MEEFKEKHKIVGDGTYISEKYHSDWCVEAFKESKQPLTESEMLEFTAEEKEKSFDDFKEWILHLLNLDNVTEDRYNQWKDFFIRHGYINEQEEVIYKPQ